MNKLFHENNTVEFSRFCIQFLNNICTIDSWYGLSIYIGRLNHLIRIRQRNPIYKNPLSQRLLSQFLTGDPEQVQHMAPRFSQSMGISLHRGCSHLRPWCAHGIFRSRKSRQTVVFLSSRPYFKKDSRHLRVAAFFGFIVCRGSFVVLEARCRASGFKRIALWAAGTGLPSANPYAVGIRGSRSVCGTGFTKDRQNTLFSYGTALTP